jgi:hypothetical protein
MFSKQQCQPKVEIQQTGISKLSREHTIKNNKDEENKKENSVKFISNNKSMMNNRRITFSRCNALQESKKKDLEITSAMKIGVYAAGAMYHLRITDISTNIWGTISVTAGHNAFADIVMGWKEAVLKAASGINQGIIRIEKNGTCEQVTMHGISFDQHAARKSSSLNKQRREMKEENKELVLLIAINWFRRGIDDQEKLKSREKQSSSVVISIYGKKMAQKCLEKGLRVAGVWPKVERDICV